MTLSCLMGSLAVGADWPDLSRPARAIGGGEHDAAVVVGVENYFAVPGVPGAKSNANEWYEYLTKTRGVPPQNVKLLTNEDATREGILESARMAASLAGKSGTLWFVYIGHGAPSADGKDGLLVGADAQQKAECLQTRSVRRGELLKALGASPASSIRVVLDACFSGRGQDGESIAPGLQPLVSVASLGVIDPRMVILTAAQGNQFAGALPGAKRPAFSYLVLGGLRGWASDKGGNITAGSLWRYAKNVLAATLRGRDQTPDLIGSESAVVATSAGEKGPDLAALAEATSGDSVQASHGALPQAKETEGYRWAKACLSMLEVLYIAEARSEKVPKNDFGAFIFDDKRFAIDLKEAEATIRPFLKSKHHATIAGNAQLMTATLENMLKTVAEGDKLAPGAWQGDAKILDKWMDNQAHLRKLWSTLVKTISLSTGGMLQMPREKNGPFTTYDFTEEQRDELLRGLQNRWGDEVRILAASNWKVFREPDKDPLAATAGAAVLYRFLSNPDLKFQEK